jgi:hypothetical protein
VLFGVARLLLYAAIVCIRSMRWLYNHGIIGFDTALRLLHLAQRLDLSAGIIATTQLPRLPAHDES